MLLEGGEGKRGWDEDEEGKWRGRKLCSSSTLLIQLLNTTGLSADIACSLLLTERQAGME